MVSVLACHPGFGAVLVSRRCCPSGWRMKCWSTVKCRSPVQHRTDAAPALLPGAASVHVQGLVSSATLGTASACEEASVTGASLVPRAMSVHEVASVHSAPLVQTEASVPDAASVYDAAPIHKSPAPHTLSSLQASMGWQGKPGTALRPRGSRRRCPHRRSGRQRLAS